MILTRKQLNEKIWEASKILRGVLESSDFKNYIIALLFLKRLSDVFEERYEEIMRESMANGRTQAEAFVIANDPDRYDGVANFLPLQARWEHLLSIHENRAEAIDVALASAEEENAGYLEGVFESVRFNEERRFGDLAEMDELMHRLLLHFSEIPLGNKNLLDPDVLGHVYEFLIEQFAETLGKNGGEFYTPPNVVRLLVEIIDPHERMRIHDPTCGTGSMLIECAQYVEERGGNPLNLTMTGQEKNYDTWAICKLNMLLHGFPDADIRVGDTIRSPKFTTNGALDSFDRVVANPPFSLKDWGFQAAEADKYGRFDLGVPPKTKGDMGFLLHMLKVVQSNLGVAGVILPHGVLFRGAAEGKIREDILKNDLVEAVIGLPAQLFFETGIPAVLLICNWNKPKERKGKVLFVDASGEGLYRNGKSRNYLEMKDVLRIASIFHGYADENNVKSASERISKIWEKSLEKYYQRQSDRVLSEQSELEITISEDFEQRINKVQKARKELAEWLNSEYRAMGGGMRGAMEKYTAVVSLKEIENNSWNLNITRYVNASEPPEQLDVEKELKHLRKLEKERDEAEAEMNRLLKEFGYGG